ncbi:hypothetical protein NEISICOT_00743 [Neisseria sicca ATCC 29256]|uniref:Uncharacterized protein n=1 Tax=Neisseria sicca ATCC 29256 TaxID=547045 RepID=C6M2K4_NEISI|nr:hypothetical protein NEISICOT_00743 [Neisseria sicca ATCC 29256]
MTLEMEKAGICGKQNPACLGRLKMARTSPRLEGGSTRFQVFRRPFVQTVKRWV